MLDAILRDYAQRPELFDWWGKLPKPEIESWEREQAVSVPSDLTLLWTTTGGGDLFESETILQPFGADDSDLISVVSEMYWAQGLDKDIYLFHKGWCLSGFRKSDASLVTLSSPEIAIIADYKDLESWYLATLRAEYEQRYGLIARD